MALIKCPECGGDVSDKAAKCIHCGHVLKEENDSQESQSRICPDCGAKVDGSELTECPVCGCPLAEDEPEEMTKVEVAKVKVSGKTKKIALAACVGVIALVLVAFGVNASIQQQNEQNAVNAYNEYVDNLTTVRTTMLTGAINAESVASTAGKVWHSAIYEDKKSKWDSSIQQYYATDFNEALALYYKDSGVSSKVSSIRDNQNQVKDLMSKLQNPPDELKSSYEAMDDLYDQYITLTNLAVNPSGNYNSFVSSYNEADSGFSTSYEKLDTQIPDKK